MKAALGCFYIRQSSSLVSPIQEEGRDCSPGVAPVLSKGLGLGAGEGTSRPKESK
jgi:hypothetical protein